MLTHFGHVLTLWVPVDSSLPGFSVHGILQARILEWDAIPFFRASYQLKAQTCISGISYIGRQLLGSPYILVT